MDAPQTTDPENLEARSKRGYASAPMWHHYANHHDGVCLMFRREDLNAAFISAFGRRILSGPVEYLDVGWVPLHEEDPFGVSMNGVTSPDEFRFRILSHFQTCWHELYLRKLTDWSHEREFRWLYLGDDDEPADVPFGKALSGIVLGEAVPTEAGLEFYKHCVEHEASCARLHWRNGQPSLQDYAEPFVTHRYLANV